jgi:cutinase
LLIVVSRLFAATGVVASALLSPLSTMPAASAAPCPDVELVFARGTFEPPGVGGTGQAFVDSLRSRLGDKSMDVYPVDYPASLDFQTAADGVIDASNKVQATAAECPNTKIVLGGFSQGAAVAGYLTADSVPTGFAMPAGLTGPMPASVADHVAAVALFGKPSSGFLQMIANTAPPITVGHLYAGKTTDMCIPDDPICSPDGGDSGAHNLYPADGLTDQAAEFVAQKVAAAAPTSPGPQAATAAQASAR